MTQRGAEEFRLSSESGGFYQLPVSAEDVGNGKTVATISPARREGLDGRDGGGPSCPGRDDGRMDMDAC